MARLIAQVVYQGLFFGYAVDDSGKLLLGVIVGIKVTENRSDMFSLRSLVDIVTISHQCQQVVGLHGCEY